MHITLATLAYLAAALIAGTTPVRAQTLPFYDVDGETARCVMEAAKGKEWIDAIKMWCQAIGKEEQVARDELAKRWGSYDQGKRMRFNPPRWRLNSLTPICSSALERPGQNCRTSNTKHAVSE